mgnify:CR=1 FL=1
MAEATKDAHAALREFVRSVAQATIEYVYDEYLEADPLWVARHEIADEVVQFIFEHAAEDPDAEIHRALRAVRGGCEGVRDG